MKNFTAILQKNPENGGCWVDIPFDVKAEFGSLRPKVKAIFDGEEEYRGSLVRMGTEHHILGVRRDIRDKLKKQPGDEISVQLELDNDPRVVVIPPELKPLLEDYPKADDYFKGLSYTHQREHAQYVAEAKKEETRIRRAKKTIENLLKDAKDKA